MFWVDEVDGDGSLVKQNTKAIRNSSESAITSYPGHKFVIKYWDEKYLGESSFVVGNKDVRLIVTYDWDISNFRITARSKVEDIIDNIKESFKLCEIFRHTAQYQDCLSEAISNDVNHLADGKTVAEKFLSNAASRLRNYTCLDSTVPPSKPKSSYDVTMDDSIYTIDVLLDLPSSKVWYIDNFITQDECNILIEHGKPRLQRATVADDGGHSVLSESRKAQQANFDHITGYDENPLWNLAQRILAVVNGHMGLELTSMGQEPFTIIQYNVGDEYTPHCDGACDGGSFLPGGRVATALMYCKVRYPLVGK